MIVNVLQINLHKSALAAAELQNNNMTLSDNYLFLIQEPSLYKGKFRNKPPSAVTYPSSFVSENPRAAIFSSRKLNMLELPNLEDRDCAVGLIKINKRSTMIASVYLDCNNREVISGKLKQLVQFSEDKNFPLLIGMDSNCHSTLYGTETNARGTILEDFIINNSLVVENVGTKPTFQSSRYSTCIDVTLSRGLSNVVKGWEVNDSFNASDHNNISFRLDGGMIEIEEWRNWDKGDWGSFTKALESASFFRPTHMTDYKLDKLVNKLYKVLNKAIELACPLIPKIKRDPVNEWYTEGMDSKRKRVAEAYDCAKRTSHGSQAWLKYKKLYKEYRSAVRKSKRKCWNLYKQKAATPKETSRLIKILQRKETNAVSTFKKVDGGSTMPGVETIDHLINAHFPMNKKPISTRYKHIKVPSYEIEGRFVSWINDDVVQEALLKFEHKKSPGPDGIKPVIFQFLPKNIIAEITFIYKACIALSFTPSAWRDSKVIFIPKPGKASYTIASAFRPISLSNYLLKGLERLCVWRVDEALMEYPIHDRQHGFRCDRSTETAISEVTNEIEKHIYKRQRTLGVFLDIKSAFDSITPEQIKKCLLNHRAPVTLVDWYYHYITHRKITIQLQGSKVSASVAIGFPQGGVASARFWLVAFNMAVKIINSQGCNGTAFADDCAVLVSGKTPSRLIKTMQKTLVEVENWGRRCGLTFNPSKTVVIMFSRRKDRDFRKLKMGGVELEYASETKYLGVTLDSRLTWKSHINCKTIAAKKMIYLVNQAVRGNWGPAPELSRWALTGVVWPALTYACVCWGHAVKTKWLKKRLDRIDRLGLLSVTQCAPSTPTQALRVIYGTPPCRLLIDKLALDTLIRYRSRMGLDWDGLTRGMKAHKSHLKYLWDKVQGWGLETLEADDIREVSPLKLFRVVTDSFAGDRKFLTRSQFNVYSDGSKTASGVGAGFTIIRNQKEILSGETKLNESCTVFQAEVLAIFEAIRTLLNSSFISGVRFLKVFSDSSAALYALRKRKCKSKVVLYTVKILNKLARMNVNISLVWIKAHVGHPGNERADFLAKRGTESEIIANWVKGPINSYKNRTKSTMLDEWDREWKSSGVARMSKQFFGEVNMQRADELIKLSRNNLTLIVTMTSGHNDLKYHLSLRDPTISPRCRLCDFECETFYHLIKDCPRLNQLRFDIFGVYQINGHLSWDTECVLDFIKSIPFNLRRSNEHDIHSFSSTSIFNSEYSSGSTVNV